MSGRTPPLPPSTLSEEQQKVYDKVRSACSSGFGNKFAWRNENGSLLGPMSALLYTPQIAELYHQMSVQAKQIPGLSVRAREVAILTTGAVMRSKYEVYAHEKLALLAGVSVAQVEAIKSGSRPIVDSTWDEQCEVAFEVALALNKPGPLSTDLWAKSKETLGFSGTLALIQYIALYSYTSIVLNAVDEPIP